MEVLNTSDRAHAVIGARCARSDPRTRGRPSGVRQHLRCLGMKPYRNGIRRGCGYVD